MSIEVVCDRDSDSTAEEVQEENIDYVELGKEPMMTVRPVWHDGVAGEESILGELFLVRAGGQLGEAAGQNDVGTARILRVVVHLAAEVSLQSSILGVIVMAWKWILLSYT